VRGDAAIGRLTTDERHGGARRVRVRAMSEGAGDRDKKAVDAVVAANASFYAAFEMLDGPAMARAWSETAPLSCIHPSGRLLEGREAVLASWREIFRATTAIHFTLGRVRVFVAKDVAWVVLTEEIEARHDESVVRAATQATNVFVHEAGGWKLVHHHAEPASSARPQAALN
jgi:ketosteroid isomerase-like protein